jgi:hypothetical protein
MVSPYYAGNRIFDMTDKISNRDNCLYSWYLLRQKLRENEIDLATQDFHSPDASDIVIYNEMPHELPHPENIHKSHLLIFESELIRPDNWDVKKHLSFNKIFTWNDAFIDNKKYFKINFAQLIPVGINKDLTKKKNLCTLIAGRKRVKHPLELYSKRLEAIRWFEKNHPEDFDLYGVSWDGYKLIGRKWSKKLSKVPVLAKYLPLRFPSYKGRIAEKRPVLGQYRFSICYENARDIPGYITEKIFDCFFAGCVPVYWGANNVTDHIPNECFIDKRDFNRYDELYAYLKNMSDREYLSYLDSIESFMKSEKGYRFSSDCFVKTVCDVLLTQ